MYHHQSRRTDPAFLRKRIKEICETHVRYGYRRVYCILRRDGWNVIMKKVYRLYTDLGLQLGNETSKRRFKAKLREDRVPPIRPNDVWAMDFVHDQQSTDRKLRILTVVDTFSRLSPVIDPRFSYSGEDVVATLDRAYRTIGYPKVIRVDNGSEFISRDKDLWAYQRAVILDFSRLGRPTDNAFTKLSTASCTASACPPEPRPPLRIVAISGHGTPRIKRCRPAPHKGPTDQRTQPHPSFLPPLNTAALMQNQRLKGRVF